MLKEIFLKIIENLKLGGSLSELDYLIDKMQRGFQNLEFMYNLSVSQPFLRGPIKGPYSYATHNFTQKRIFAEPSKSIKFIICCDNLCNESNRNYFDVSIFVDGSNINSYNLNNEKNTTSLYRITSCAFRIKGKTVRSKYEYIENMSNSNLNAILKYDKDNIWYYDGKTVNKTKTIFDINTLTNDREFVHTKISKDYKKIGLDKSNWYFIIDVNDFEYFELIKHVEHVPLQEYEEIFNVNINENVW